MDYEKKLKRITAATKALHRMIGAVLLLALVFVGSTVYDMYAFTEAGRGTSFPGFKDLLSQNKDTVAWLKMDGTHIDHPVVQGKDNFEYINKGFDGKFYQGGSIFLMKETQRTLQISTSSSTAITWPGERCSVMLLHISTRPSLKTTHQASS